MTQESIMRRGEEIASTTGCEEMCLMAIENSGNHLVGERQSTVRPPLFISDNYVYWKTRMRLFIQGTDYEAWRVIVNGPLILTKKVGDEDVIKEESKWDANDIKMAQLNVKAMHTLFCALGANEYIQVSLCKNAKKVWDKLQVTHEGTNKVKETKVGMLTHEYELFSMKPKESISEMYNQFATIITNLKGLGKTCQQRIGEEDPKQLTKELGS